MGGRSLTMGPSNNRAFTVYLHELCTVVAEEAAALNHFNHVIWVSWP